jgi:hypothetical protein
VIQNFITQIRTNNKLLNYDEASTKNAIILPILNNLGWNPFNIDEIQPEYPIENQRVDYALISDGTVKVFIEAKKTDEELENHQEQLLNYSFKKGVPLAILTNGINWWFYLPLKEGGWNQRKFYSINIFEQEPEDISRHFSDYLSKDNCISGINLKNAENVFKGNQKLHSIETTLPQAWEKIVRDKDEEFIELLSERTEQLCGYKPDAETIERFISTNINPKISQIHQKSANINKKSDKKPLNSSNKISKINLDSSYTYKDIQSFRFLGNDYPVKNWTDLLLHICNIMYQLKGIQFENVLSLKGRKKPYFSTNINDLRDGHKIQGTKIYVEKNLSANSKVKLIKTILELFSYSQEDIQIITK